MVDGVDDTRLTYVDALARQWADEPCMNCSGGRGWKTSAMLYEGMEWQYYRCYECESWWKRHSKYRYMVFRVSDERTADLLRWRLESDRDHLNAGLGIIDSIRRKLNAIRNVGRRVWMRPADLLQP